MKSGKHVAMPTDLIERFLDETRHRFGKPLFQFFCDLLLARLVPEFLDLDEKAVDELRVDGRGAIYLNDGNESGLK